MKAFLSFILLLALCTGCEEVIDLKLDSQEQQLVVDAALDWEKGLVMSLEKEFDCEIPDEDAEKITTVQTAIDYVKANS